MATASTAFALRLLGQDHALEPGRDYLLGTGVDCDLRLTGGSVGSHHARLVVGPEELRVVDLGTPGGTLRNGLRVTEASLALGDVLHCGDCQLTLVADRGEALIVPLPGLRAAAERQRLVAIAARAAALNDPDAHRTFQELMAAELRRAPWFALSMLAHGLLLALLWWWLPPPPAPGAPAAVGWAPLDERSEGLQASPVPPPVTAEPELPPDPTPVVALPFPEPAAEPPADPLPDHPSQPTTNPSLAGPRATKAAASPPPTRSAGNGQAPAGSAAFQTRVGDLRRSGLEIVFVFDSTGSMTGTILDTKNSIAQMLSVLRELVPDARIGLVTYRDRGKREAYLVRSIPLGQDFWRAANFVQFVQAGGGGDLPEAVASGLREAFQQRWQDQARRVVILAGDAPPHEEELQRLLADVAAFARNGRSVVHTLLTSPDQTAPGTREAFTAIARAGKGSCLDLQQHERVLSQVLTLAFGREFDRDVAAVIDAAEQRGGRTATWALDLARAGGPPLVAALQKTPVDYEVLNALVRLPRREVAAQLVELLGRAETPGATRQAIAWALQRMLRLEEPPIDPATDGPPRPAALIRLQRLAERLPE